MQRKLVVAIVAALVVALLLLQYCQPGAPPPVEAPTIPTAPPAAAEQAALAGAAAGAGAAGDTAPREAPVPVGAEDRGDLVVRVLYGDDRAPAADVLVTAFRQHETPRNSSSPSVDSKRRRTDAAGIARFPSLRAGRTGLIVDRGHWYTKAYVVGGKQSEVEFVLPVGVNVRGVVVSALGVPVAGAEVELESTVVTTTDAAGRFAVRGVAAHYMVGARAAGHGAAKAQQLLPQGGTAEVRLELGPAGGIVEGTVQDPDGRPLADVRVEIGRYEGVHSMAQDAPPRPARPRTDADGRFRALGIAPGEVQLKARVPGFVPWSGTCLVAAGAVAVVPIVVARGNTLRGLVRDAEGRPCGDVLVSATSGRLEWEEVVARDGTFVFTGIPDGEVEVKVDAEALGAARTRVAMTPGGAVTTCELTLVCGFVTRGRVRDEAGQGLAHVNVRWQPSRDRMGYTFTDETGAFAFANTPEGVLTIDLDGDAIDDARFEKVDPRAGELDLRVRRRAAKTSYISGIVLDPDGRPAVARVWTSGGGSRDIVEKTTDGNGFFEFGPVAPGEWHLVIESRTFPTHRFPRQTVAADARWDVGTVRLVPGGTLAVTVVGAADDVRGISFADANEQWSGLRVDNGRGTSEPLPVGSYRLFTTGKEHAAAAIPFEIRAGATTQLEVRLRDGVRQRFALDVPAAAPTRGGWLRIQRGTDLVTRVWAAVREGQPCTAEACLEPGEYSATAQFGALTATTSFTVGAREGDAVRLALVVPPK